MSDPLLPFDRWPSGISQASVPANNNARRADILASPALSATTAAQPASPTDGDVYIIPSGATGAQWATFDEDDITIFYEGTWTAFAPPNGMPIFVVDEDANWQFKTGTGWSVESGGGGSAVSSVNGDTGVVIVAAPIIVACSDETTALTTGTAKATFRMPYAFTLTAVRASVTTAPTGSALTVDINEGGVSILSTKITIDATEKTSTTAVTPPVISDSALSDDSEITIDIDTVGSTIAGSGLKVTLIGYAS